MTSVGTLIVLLSAPLVGNCGGSTHNGADGSGFAGTSSTSGGSTSGGAASLPSAGSASTSGGSSGGNAHAGAAGSPSGGGSSPAGGTSVAGGAGGTSSAGDSGAASGGESDAIGSIGWACGSDVCERGQACVRCSVQGQSQQFCVPHPEQDPNGYASATAKCQAEPNGYDDCDGPEDCSGEKYCVARTSPDGFIRCRDEPSTKGFCCFFCDALPDCTLCRTNADCAPGESCEPTELPDSRGCKPAR